MRYTEAYFKEHNIPFLPEPEYRKAVGQFGLQLNAIMEPLVSYGQKVYVDQAILEIIRLTEDFGLRVRGLDHPLDVEQIRRGKGRR